MFRKFNYYDPTTWKEFISLANKLENFKVLAGGTDLLVRMKNGNEHYENIIDIKKIRDIKDINTISFKNNGLLIGALVNFNEIKENYFIKTKLSALYQASCVMGCYEIRNRATIGGNIANRSSGAETGVVLLVYDAVLIVKGKDGFREISVEEFYKDKNILKKDEIITHIHLPYIHDNLTIYLRRSRTKGMDLASINLCIGIFNINNKDKFKIKISAGAVAPIPIRFPEIEKKFNVDNIKDLKFIEEMRKELQNSINPRPTSKRASPEYKKDQLGYLFTKGLKQLLNLK